MMVTLLRSLHKMTAPYSLLEPGESGSQLWERLPPLPYEWDEGRCYGYTILTSGVHGRAMVMMWEATGLRVYRAVVRAKDRETVELEVGT